MSVFDKREIKQNGFDIYEDAYYKYRSHLFGVAFNYLKNQSLAEDAVQDAFAAVLSKRSLEKVDPGKIKAYLSITVSNIALNMLKKESRYSGEEPDESLPGIDLQLEGSETALCLNSLPKIYRDTLIMRFDIGFSPKEIARIQNVKYKTVLARIERGRAMLKELLKESDS